MLNEIGFLKKIESICTKPNIYVGLNTFDEVTDYLEMSGRYFIVGKFYYHSVFTPFLKWFAEKHTKDTFISLEEFQKEFPSSDEALKKLPVLYKEYINDVS